MPDYNDLNDLSGLPDQAPNDDLGDLPDQGEPQQSSADWWIEQGLRTAPPVIGSFLGGLAGIPALGIGAIGGGMAGGAAGAGIGDLLGNWYSGKETNPYELALTTATGAMPPIFGNAQLEGQGLRALAKYAGGSALRGAAEGAYVSGISTPLQKWIETGDPSNATWQDYAHNIGAGAAFGTVLGGGMGAVHGHYANAPHVETPPLPGTEAPPNSWPPEGFVPSGQLPEEQAFYARNPPQEPQDQMLPWDDPYQESLKFGPYRGANGRMTNEGPAYQGPRRADLPEPVPQQFDFGEPDGGSQGSLFPPDASGPVPPPPAPPSPPAGNDVGPTNNVNITGPNVIPDGTTLSPNQQVVTIRSPDAGALAYWRSQGYVPVAGLRSPEGYPQLVRGDVAPLYVTGDKRAPSAPAAPIQPPIRPEVPGAVSDEQVGVVSGQPIPVPNSRVTQGFLNNMEQNGYTVIDRNATHTIFAKTAEGPSEANDMGGNQGDGGDELPPTGDPNHEQWVEELLKKAHELGINPDNFTSMGELAHAVEQGFDPYQSGPYDRGSVLESSGPPPPTDGNIPLTQWPPNSGTLQSPVYQGPQVMNEPRFPEIGPMGEGAPPNRVVPGMEIPPEGGGMDLSGFRQQSLFPPDAPNPHIMDTRMADRVDAGYGGPRVFDYTRAPNQEGQMELPWSRGENPQPIDADAAAREVQAAADRFKQAPGENPVQQSMMPQFLDAEIQNYLKNEDGRPPEATDLSGYVSEARGPKGDPPPSLQNGVFDGAVAHMQQETDPRVLQDYLDMVTKAIQYHRAGDDPAELNLYHKLREVLVDKLNSLPPSGSVLHSEMDLRAERKRLQDLAGKALRSAKMDEFLDYRKQIDVIDEQIRNQRPDRTVDETLRRLFSDVDNLFGDRIAPKEGDSPETIALKRDAAAFQEHVKGRELTPEEESMYGMLLNDLDPEGNSVPQDRNFLKESTGIGPDEFIRMEVGDRVAILRNMQGQYAEHGARVANKELLQNAIDATNTGGRVEVSLNYHDTTGKGKSITVKDTGPGLSLDLLKNEYITLTGSGKRGVASPTGRKTIGEMGVGKATYLLGTDSFEITTVTKEANGEVWKYEVNGNPDSMVGEDAAGNAVAPSKIVKTRMPDNTPTGTEVTVYDKSVENIKAAQNYLKAFADYSSSPVEVKLKSNQYTSPGYLSYNLDRTVAPSSPTPGRPVTSGSAPGGNFTISVPDHAVWNDEASSIQVILNNRGMFQGVETLYPGGVGKIPDRVVVDIDPTVTAQDAKNYPLTSPTRERMKGEFKAEVNKAIKKDLMEAAEQKRKDDIQAAFDTLVPAANPLNPSQPLSFVTNDRGGRYTQAELDNFNGNPRVQAVAGVMKNMLDTLDGLFPTGQVTKTNKFGFDLADVNKGGINITPPNDPSKSLIMVNLHSALHDAGGDPKAAAEIFVHTILHEFTHNLARSEGAGFTWEFRKTDSRFTTERRAEVVKTISKLFSGPNGQLDPGISQLLQEHTAARGRPDTTVDYIARQAESNFIEKPRQGGVSSSSEPSGKATAAPTVETKAQKEAAQKEQETHWVREALNVPKNATTMLDLSAPGRQGLSMILTPEFWKAIPAMFGSLHYDTYKKIDANLMSKPIMQDKIDLNTGKAIPSFAKQIGLKTFSPASEGIGPRAEQTASKWLEVGIGNDPLSKAWKNTMGVPIRATNRAFITFLNHLNVNRTEKLLDLARNMSIRGLDTGRTAMPGVMGGIHLPDGGNIGFTQKVTPTEAMNMNPYHNLPLAREIAEFVNAATGHATAKGGMSLENAVSKIGPVLFSPGLLNSRIRMLNPVTYAMASPFVRKQYAKAALSTAAAWFVATQLIKNSAGENATVSNDITSADFGKVRIGDARLDLGGGFLQFATAYGRLYSGGATSSSSGEYHRFGSGYQAQTAEDMMERFLVNKLDPTAKFAFDTISASEYNPMHMGDRTVQMFVPLFIQDLHEIAKEDPSLLPLFGTASLFGGGSQIYSKGESISKFIDPENDWNVTGGGVRDLMPWNWNKENEPRNFPWSQPE